MSTTPGNDLHPWRRTARTAVASVIGLASVLPYVVAEVHIAGPGWAALSAQVTVVSTTVTRIMAMGVVQDWLADYAPWLSATPRADR